MDMAEGQRTRDAAGRFTTPLAVVAVGSVLGFLYWLYVTAEPTTVAVVEEAPADTAFAAVAPTEWASFSTGPRNYVGMRLRFDSIAVVSRLGNAAFWTNLANETPFLMRLDSALVAQGFTVTGGDELRVIGTVHEMTDSVLDAWQQSGVLSNDMQRAEAEFATLFIEVERAELKPRGPGAPGSEGEGEGTGS